MALLKVFLLVLALLTPPPLAYPASVGNVIKVATITKDVLEFGLKLSNFIQSQNSDEMTEVSEEMIATIQQMIETSETNIIDTIALNAKFDKLDNAVIAVHNAMIILKRILSTRDPAQKAKHVELFLKNYLSVLEHIHFLPELLSYSVPGNDYRLLPQIMKVNRCNLSVLKDFANFYLGLLEDGFAIVVAYYRFKYHTDIPGTVKVDWKKWLTNVQNIFTVTEADCETQFTHLAKEDFLRATDALTLGRENTERYLHNWFDLIFYAPVGTHQFHYYMTNANKQFFYQKTDSQNKLAVYGSRTEKMIFDKTKVQSLLRNANFGIPSRRDQNAAKHLCESVRSKLKEHGYIVSTIVAYFNGPKFNIKGQFNDPDSPLITYTLPGVVLEYCYESGVVCTAKNWFGKTKTTSGSFDVHVYLSEEETPDHLSVHGGAEKHSDIWRLLMLVMFLSVLSYTTGK